MRVALTGGTGFIGNYVVKALAARGHEVRVLGRPSSRHRLPEAPGVEWVEGDLADPAALERLVDGTECVLHNAYDWDALRVGPARNWAVNLHPSLELLELARTRGRQQYIYVSSVAVYGPVLSDRPLDETHPAWPDSLYGALKAMVEDACHGYFHQYGLNTSCWRPAQVYGIPLASGREPDWARTIRSVAAGGRFDSDAGGSIVTVEDTALALALAVGNDAVAGGLYNLVDCYLYVQQVAEIAKELSGSDAEIVDRVGGAPPRYRVISERARALGVPLDHGLEGVRRHVARVLTEEKERKSNGSRSEEAGI